MVKLTLLFGFIFLCALGVSAFQPPERLKPFLNWRIVGGSKAPEGAFSYQASIRGSDDSHNCGGSIISATIVLTAAHCVHRQSTSQLSVVVGSNRLSSGGARHGVSSIRVHERYNSITLKNDVAILKLSSPIIISSTVRPIELETSYIGGNVDVVLSGWGTTTHPGSFPNELQYIFLRTISVSDCKQRHSRNVDDSQICTLTQTGEGACHGDAGGPLVANGVLIGIVSWGRPCAIGYPDVFARVSYYIDWINKNSI